MNNTNLEGKTILGDGGKKYLVHTMIGSGGFGEIWKVESNYHGKSQHFAMKRLHQRYFENAPIIERFLTEGEVMTQLDHPHIITTHEFGFDSSNDVHYILMELMDHDLSPYLKRSKAMDMSRAREVITGIGDALVYSHHQHIFHRDVHPGNILFNGKRVVLSDFGISKIMTDSPFYNELREKFSGNSIQSINSINQNLDAIAGFSGGDEDLRQLTSLWLGHIEYRDLEYLRGENGNDTEQYAMADQFSFGKVAFNLFDVVADQRMMSIASRATNSIHKARYRSIEEMVRLIRDAKDYFSALNGFTSVSTKITTSEVRSLEATFDEACRDDPENVDAYQKLIGVIEQNQRRFLCDYVDRTHLNSSLAKRVRSGKGKEIATDLESIKLLLDFFKRSRSK